MAHELQRDGDSLVVKVRGRLDAQTTPALEADMAGALEGVVDVTFDLDGVDYLSSAGLRVLFATYKLMAKRGGAMRVAHVGEGVMDVLSVSGFADIFAIEG